MNKRTGISIHGMIDLSHVVGSRPHDMAVWHYHEGYEIYFQTAGSRYMFYGSHRYLVTKGAVAVFKPYELHYGESADLEYYERYAVNFTDEYVEKVLGSKTEADKLLSRMKSGIFYLSERQTAFLAELFDMLIKEREKKLICNDTVFGCEMITMLNFVAENCVKDGSFEAVAQELPSEIMKAVEYINDNYGKPMSLEDVSQAVSLDKFYFSHLFKKYTGVTVMQHICGVRAECAHRLLNMTDMSVEQIAQASGFGSYINMERAFKKKYNMTPIQIRKQQ